VSVDAFAGAGGGGGSLAPVASVRVTAPLAGQLALEGFVSLPDRRYSSYSGVYAIEVRQRLVRASQGRTDAFMTYGAMGGYTYVPGRDHGNPIYDGRTGSYRKPTNLEVIPPVIALVGAGVEQRVARRLTVRFDFQGLVAPSIAALAGLRITAGVAVPLGRAPMPSD
jgi:hypothetical protein